MTVKMRSAIHFSCNVKVTATMPPGADLFSDSLKVSRV